MTNGDRIRAMQNSELVDLLVWGSMGLLRSVPGCDEGCDYFGGGCAIDCPHERRERTVREWLEEEYK